MNELICKVCGRTIAIYERFTSCKYTRKDGVIVRWLRCEECQQLSQAVIDSARTPMLQKVKPMQRMDFRKAVKS